MRRKHYFKNIPLLEKRKSVKIMERESRSIPKMCGLETELGLILKGGYEDSVKDAANFVGNLNNNLIPGTVLPVSWDPLERILAEEKISDRAARKEEHCFFEHRRWRNKQNRFLANGARFYLDFAHPEISTPLCRDPKMLLVWNRACYRFIEKIQTAYQRQSSNDYRILRNNLAADETVSSNIRPEYPNSRKNRRASFGSHLNITVSRKIEIDKLIRYSVPWFILQTYVSGAGKARSDAEPHTDFQISQRADFIKTISDHGTMCNRPIFNLRDAPYADPDIFRRVHIIPFDSNMLELPEYLKTGLVSVLFMMMEDGEIDDRFWIAQPVEALRRISRDVNLRENVFLAGGKNKRRAVDCLLDYRDAFAAYLEAYHPRNEILRDVVARFSSVAEKLAAGNLTSLFGKLDWVTKKFMLEEFASRRSKQWNDPALLELDYKYHDNGRDGLFYKLIHPRGERITNDEEIDSALAEPPPTRSKWMVQTVKYLPEVTESDYWYSACFALKNINRSGKIFFTDPTVAWSEETAKILFSLSPERFAAEIPEAVPGAKTALYRQIII